MARMRAVQPLVGLLVSMGYSRGVPLSPASSRIPKTDFQEASGSGGVRSRGDASTVLLLGGVAAAIRAILILVAVFLF